MCKAPTERHKVLGMRLNTSQGRSPRSVTGIAVGVRRCEACGLISPDPLPLPESLEAHYDLDPKAYWKADYFDPDPTYFSSEIATAKRLIGFRPGMRALDIGSGMGKAMKALERAGFDVFGIEPSPSFRLAAIERNGIAADRVQQAALEAAVFSCQFDFITFGAVLEHLYHPAAAIERALTWLAPGGVIQIEVPSSTHALAKLANLYFRLKGTNYVTHISPMHPPFHLYEFGLESFIRHGRRAGYAVGEYEFHQNDVLFVPIPRMFHPLLTSYMRRTRQGMQLTVWLRKAEQEGLRAA
jgi:SAM-dependent methyltransferase